MSDDASLPASDDPHEVLGVPESADEATLKRAYAERVKQFRPDRHPEEFQRVRRAYEQALEWWSLHRTFEDPFDADDADEDDEDEDDEKEEGEDGAAGGADLASFVARHLDAEFELVIREGSPGDRDAEVAAAWAEAWEDVAAGRGPEASARLLARTTDRPRDAAAWGLRFLVAEAQGEDDPQRILVQGLEAGAELAGFSLAVLEHDVLELAPRVSWAVLARQADRDSAVRLFDARLVAAVTGGTVQSFAREELLRREFQDASRDHQGLRWIGLRAACALCFDHPEEADELFERLAREPIEDGSVEDAFLARRALREEWDHFARSAAAAKAPALRAFVAACHSLHPVDLASLGLEAAVREAPGASLAAFDLLFEEAPGLIHLFLEGADLCLGEREQDTSEEASRSLASRLATFVRSTDEALRKDRGNRLDSALGGLLAAGTGLVFLRHGAWGVVPLVITLAWLLFHVSRVDRRLYAQIVRPRALRALVRFDALPDDLIAAIKARTRLTDDIGRFDGELSEDLALHALGLALRTDAREE